VGGATTHSCMAHGTKVFQRVPWCCGAVVGAVVLWWDYVVATRDHGSKLDRGIVSIKEQNWGRPAMNPTTLRHKDRT